ncbi:hypothetical protein HLH17_13940 [Acinetobacter sp. ANC 5380]|uniref:Uncharacterized protein n=1 Tax=Acinetobacter terrae TaxID=2731247 RepID=A0A7Y2RH91_9GAMM|nr:hypothetical protein [Acinetobacter terrae]NNH78730.1 hypothetical protein [Acinetobacter terrae]
MKKFILGLAIASIISSTAQANFGVFYEPPKINLDIKKSIDYIRANEKTADHLDTQITENDGLVLEKYYYKTSQPRHFIKRLPQSFTVYKLAFREKILSYEEHYIQANCKTGDYRLTKTDYNLNGSVFFHTFYEAKFNSKEHKDYIEICKML